MNEVHGICEGYNIKFVFNAIGKHRLLGNAATSVTNQILKRNEKTTIFIRRGLCLK